MQSGLEKHSPFPAKISEFESLFCHRLTLRYKTHPLLALGFPQNMVVYLPDPVIVSNELLFRGSLLEVAPTKKAICVNSGYYFYSAQ